MCIMRNRLETISGRFFHEEVTPPPVVSCGVAGASTFLTMPKYTPTLMSAMIMTPHKSFVFIYHRVPDFASNSK